MKMWDVSRGKKQVNKTCFLALSNLSCTRFAHWPKNLECKLSCPTVGKQAKGMPDTTVETTMLIFANNIGLTSVVWERVKEIQIDLKKRIFRLQYLEWFCSPFAEYNPSLQFILTCQIP